MQKIFILLLFCSFGRSIVAQEAAPERQGTIKVQKKGQFSKIHFDNVNYRLIGIDQYGNVIDTAVVEFQMSVTVKGIFYSETTAGPMLSSKMQQLLGKCDGTTKIFFDNIKVKERNGAIINMPKFQYTYGYSEENNY